jgi:hypothetical protein
LLPENLSALKREVRRLLQRELLSKQQVNSRYSLRAFGAFLEIHPSFLSQIMNGKRFISEATLEKIGTRLNLENEKLDVYKQILKKSRQAPSRSKHFRIRVKR